MIVRFMGTLFAPKQPRFYTGRHRARFVRSRIASSATAPAATTSE